MIADIDVFDDFSIYQLSCACEACLDDDFKIVQICFYYLVDIVPVWEIGGRWLIPDSIAWSEFFTGNNGFPHKILGTD